MNDPGMMGESGFDKRLQDNVRRLDEQSGYIQDLLSEKIDHLRSEVHGNDKRYAERFAAQESATKYAQEKANEFRGSLDDVGKKQMPRTEAEAMFRMMAEKDEQGRSANAEKIQALQARMDRNEGRGTMVDPLVAKLAADVASLTVSRGEGTGKSEGIRLTTGFIVGALALAVTLITIVVFVANFLPK